MNEKTPEYKEWREVYFISYLKISKSYFFENLI